MSVAGRIQIAIIVFSICAGMGCSKKKAEQPVERKQTSARTSTPTAIDTKGDEESLTSKTGHIVFLNNVQLEPGPTDETVYAVGKNGEKVLVEVKDAPKIAPNSKAKFDVQGSVEKTPSASTMRKRWKMKKDEANEVQKIGVYVEGETVSASSE